MLVSSDNNTRRDATRLARRWTRPRTLDQSRRVTCSSRFAMLGESTRRAMLVSFDNIGNRRDEHPARLVRPRRESTVDSRRCSDLAGRDERRARLALNSYIDLVIACSRCLVSPYSLPPIYPQVPAVIAVPRFLLPPAYDYHGYRDPTRLPAVLPGSGPG